MSEPPRRFPLRLPADLHAELARVAAHEGRTLTNLILHALKEWLAGRGKGQPR